MDLFTTILGAFTLAHGIFWALMRSNKAPAYDKLFSLAAKIGFTDRAFAFFYATIPIIVGNLLVIAGLMGFPLPFLPR